MLPKTAFKSNGTNTPALKLSDVYEHSGVDMTGRRKRASNYDNETVYWYTYICMLKLTISLHLTSTCNNEGTRAACPKAMQID